MEKKRGQKLGKREQVVEQTIRNCNDLSTHDLTMRLNLAQADLLKLGEEITEHNNRLLKARARLAFTTAEAEGFTRLLRARSRVIEGL